MPGSSFALRGVAGFKRATDMGGPVKPSHVARASVRNSDASRPISRVLWGRFLRLRDGHSSGTSVAGRLEQPTRAAGLKTSLEKTPRRPYSVLLPVGFAMPPAVTGGAVRSYRTLSPLPRMRGGLLSVALSLGSPPPDVIRHRVSVEPGLSSPLARSGRPAGWHALDVGPRGGRGQGLIRDSTSTCIPATMHAGIGGYNAGKAERAVLLRLCAATPL
jgi:hypothetical protein